jgi:hypothetical protein
MLGSASTQQLFASANSIAAVPNIWAEWNYNAFVPPYLTVSSSSQQILSASFNSAAAWTTIIMGTNVINTKVSTSASGVGITNVWEPTGSALYITLLNKLENKNSTTQTYNNGDIIGAVQSSSVLLNNGVDSTGFYKFVFYVKAAGTNYSSGFPSKILGSAVTATTTSTVAPTSNYSYRIVGVTSDGISLGIDMLNDTDVKTINSSNASTASITLKWTADQNAAAYRIYKSVNNTDDTTYLTTVNSASYVDDFGKNIVDSYSPGFFSSNVTVVPNITASNSAGTEVQPISFVKTSLGSNGSAEIQNGSIEAKLDSWTKIEMWFGIPATSPDQAFSKINLNLVMTADYENSSIYLDNIELYNITEHDYFLNSLFPTESAFYTLRPGETLVNTLLPSKDKTLRNFSHNTVVRKPSFGFKSPSIYIAKEKVAPQIQILPSQNDAFEYYISSNTNRAIQAKYSQYLSINKIVIKHFLIIRLNALENRKNIWMTFIQTLSKYY